MRLLLTVILSVFLFTIPVFGQTEKPQTIIVPTGSLGEISETRIKILEKTLESKLGEYFEIVPKQLFEEAQEKAFEELDYEECTENQCIMMIQEMLQVENAFQLVLIYEEGDTQLSVTWTDLDQKRVKEEYCEGCKTKELRKTIAGLVDNLIGVKEKVLIKVEPPKKVEPVVVETSKVVSKVVQEPVVQKIENDETNGLFVTVGDSGTILTSSDGITWITRRSERSEYLFGVTYGDRLFVTVGSSGTILTSSDGKYWTLRNSGTSNELNGITYGNGHFITVGKRGTILISSNGISWISVTSGTSEYLWGVKYLNGLFVTVGDSGTILTSSDGITWITRRSERSEYLFGVTYGDRLFVTVGSSGTILTSSDGKYWTLRNSGTSNELNGITYGNGMFITVGDESTIFTSLDGNSWSEKNSGKTEGLTGVTYGNGLFVIVNKKGKIFTSSNGTTWTQRNSGLSESIWGVTYSQ